MMWSISQSWQFGRSTTDEFFREILTSHNAPRRPTPMTTHNAHLQNQRSLERQFGSPNVTQKRIDRIAVPRAMSVFLLATDWTTKLQFYRSLEERAFKEYAIANPMRQYRGGISKSSFCYLLLDPRVTRDLPSSGSQLSVGERWKRFLEGVFYVGQGKAARPEHHLHDAINIWSNRKHVTNISCKIQRILDIWKEKKGVICLNVFSHTMVEEACSREASMIEVLEANLTNRNNGTYYGQTTMMSAQEKLSLGKYLLYKAMEIFMHEGERQIFPPSVSVVSEEKKRMRNGQTKTKPMKRQATKTKPMKREATKTKPMKREATKTKPMKREAMKTKPMKIEGMKKKGTINCRAFRKVSVPVTEEIVQSFRNTTNISIYLG